MRSTAARPRRSGGGSRKYCGGSGGYNIDSISEAGHNMARLLVGSKGTLAFVNEIDLDLQPIPVHRVLGICHFSSFYSAMAATQKIVELGPSAVELVDRAMIDLSRDIPMFHWTSGAAIHKPDCVSDIFRRLLEMKLSRALPRQPSERLHPRGRPGSIGSRLP